MTGVYSAVTGAQSTSSPLAIQFLPLPMGETSPTSSIALELVPSYHAALLRGGAPRSGSLFGGRRLTVTESALLQTFPPETCFFGSKRSQYTQVGNAVPPLLAKLI